MADVEWLWFARAFLVSTCRLRTYPQPLEYANFSASACITSGHETGGLFIGGYHEVDLALGAVLVHFVEAKDSVVRWQDELSSRVVYGQLDGRRRQAASFC